MLLSWLLKLSQRLSSTCILSNSWCELQAHCLKWKVGALISPVVTVLSGQEFCTSEDILIGIPASDKDYRQEVSSGCHRLKWIVIPFHENLVGGSLLRYHGWLSRYIIKMFHYQVVFVQIFNPVRYYVFLALSFGALTIINSVWTAKFNLLQGFETFQIRGTLKSGHRDICFDLSAGEPEAAHYFLLPWYSHYLSYCKCLTKVFHMCL